MKCVAVVFFVMFIISCRESGDRSDSSCLCEGIYSKPLRVLDSKIIPGDVRCHDLFIEYYTAGKKAGVCYNGPLLKGIDKEAVDPDPEACQALQDKAERECKKLPPDPASWDQPASGSVVYGNGIVSIDGQVVSVNGRPGCICQN